MKSRALTLAAAGALIALSACSSGNDEDSADSRSTDPLEQMSVAFQGSPSIEEIQRSMDNAFAATDTETTAENYSRAGSTLVSLRKEYGIEEMDILECIPTRQTDPRIATHDFPSVAAVCVTDIASGG